MVGDELLEARSALRWCDDLDLGTVADQNSTPMPGWVKSLVISLRISVSTEKEPRCFWGWRHRYNAVLDAGLFPSCNHAVVMS